MGTFLDTAVSNAANLSVDMSLFHHPSDSRSPTEASAAGLLAAAAVAIVCACLVPTGAVSWTAAGAIAATFLAAVLAVASAVGWWRLGNLGRMRRADTPGPLSSPALAAAWMAPAALLCVRDAWTALPVSAALGVLVARQLLVSEVEGETWEPAAEPFLAGMGVLAPSPAATERRIASQAAAMAAYCALALATMGSVVAASAMAAIASAILACLTARQHHPKRDRRNGIRSAAGIFLAALIATMALAPRGGGGPRNPQGPDGEAAAPGPSLNYSSVVLLADPPPERALPAPPLPPSRGPGREAIPLLSIPFSGEYWYYFWPMQRPAGDALRKPGSPLTLAYRWIDQGKLIVQARQPLSEPIESRCCRAIDVVLEGREEQPDTVYLELALRSAPEQKPVSLGIQPLPASSSRRLTLSFDTPRDGSIRSFDQIVVFFHLDPDLRRRSPNLAIKRFNLIP